MTSKNIDIFKKMLLCSAIIRCIVAKNDARDYKENKNVAMFVPRLLKPHAPTLITICLIFDDFQKSNVKSF